MNSIMFKKVWNLMYQALTYYGYNEPMMYEKGMSLQIPTTNDHYFSIVFVNCRKHFETMLYDEYDGRKKGMKTFGTADEIRTVECIYTDYEFVKTIHGDKETMEMDFNSLIEDVYTVMNAVQIDWSKVITDWIESDILISKQFEEHCSIRAGKEIREKLKELISY